MGTGMHWTKGFSHQALQHVQDQSRSQDQGANDNPARDVDFLDAVTYPCSIFRDASCSSRSKVKQASKKMLEKVATCGNLFGAPAPCWPGPGPKHISNVDSYSVSVEGSQGACPKGTLFLSAAGLQGSTAFSRQHPLSYATPLGVVMINASPCKITLLSRMKISNRASLGISHCALL